MIDLSRALADPTSSRRDCGLASSIVSVICRQCCTEARRIARHVSSGPEGGSKAYVEHFGVVPSFRDDRDTVKK
jgi:hypothetical protein